MFTEEYKGINSFLVGASNLLRKYGVKRETRGSVCYDFQNHSTLKLQSRQRDSLLFLAVSGIKPCRMQNPYG